jgi:hypothetical protein
MSDDDRPKPKRLQTANERDIASAQARRERERVPEFVTEECTGQYEGADLDAARARRPTPQRLAVLERKHDKLSEDVAQTREDVAEIRGHHGAILNELHDDMKARRADAADAKKNARERVTKVIGGLASGGVIVEILHRLGVL